MEYHQVIDHLKHGWQLIYWHHSYNFVLHREEEKQFVHPDVVTLLQRDCMIKEGSKSKLMTVYELE